MLCLAESQASSQFHQTKSGIALLYNEETSNTYDVCLRLSKEALTIQKLDVVCTSGSESQVNVSAPEGCGLEFSFMPHNVTVLFQFSQYPFANKKLPLSKAQNCCTAKTSGWRPGLKHQSKQIRSDYGQTEVGRHDCLSENLSSFFSSSLSRLQGGAEHNVPVVISKIFKDQVGKELFNVELGMVFSVASVKLMPDLSLTPDDL